MAFTEEQVDDELFKLEKAEKRALEVLRSIHFMQRDLIYTLEDPSLLADIGPTLSYEKEYMIGCLDAIANYCGFELTRKEDE